MGLRAATRPLRRGSVTIPAKSRRAPSTFGLSSPLITTAPPSRAPFGPSLRGPPTRGEWAWHCSPCAAKCRPRLRVQNWTQDGDPIRFSPIRDSRNRGLRSYVPVSRRGHGRACNGVYPAIIILTLSRQWNVGTDHWNDDYPMLYVYAEVQGPFDDEIGAATGWIALPYEKPSDRRIASGFAPAVDDPAGQDPASTTVEGGRLGANRLRRTWIFGRGCWN